MTKNYELSSTKRGRESDASNAIRWQYYVSKYMHGLQTATQWSYERENWEAKSVVANVTASSRLIGTNSVDRSLFPSSLSLIPESNYKSFLWPPISRSFTFLINLYILLPFSSFFFSFPPSLSPRLLACQPVPRWRVPPPLSPILKS